MEEKDESAVLEYVAKQFASMVHQATPNGPPSLLWHYTRPEAFLKIVEAGTLRASHIQYMNDER